MKILHTSDLHLGITLCGMPLLPFQKEFCKTLRDMSDKADAVIISGDIFDTSVASAEAVRCWSSLAADICLDRGVPLIVCAGNHDGAARLSSCSELLKAAGLYISGTLDDAFTPVIIGNTAIYSLPWYNPSDAASLLDCEPNAADVMRAVTKKILSEADRSKCNILAAHCFVTGASPSESDISARAVHSVGGADCIPADVFSGFDYVALGHLHRAQTVSVTVPATVPENGTVIRYSGAPLPYSFGEAGTEKTVSLYDTESGVAEELPVPLPYTLRTVEDSCENVLALAEKDERREDFMKIVLTDRYGGDSIFMRLKEIYPNLLHFSGRTPVLSGVTGVTAKEAAELDIISLAIRYSEERRGEKPDGDELKWLQQALSDE